MRVLSPMIEPPLRRLDGSTARTATRCPAAVRRGPSSSMNVDLPAPGVPLIPTRTAPPVAGSTASSSGDASARRSGRVDSTSVIDWASARRSPARTRSASASVSALTPDRPAPVLTRRPRPAADRRPATGATR